MDNDKSIENIRIIANKKRSWIEFREDKSNLRFRPIFKGNWYLLIWTTLFVIEYFFRNNSYWLIMVAGTVLIRSYLIISGKNNYNSVEINLEQKNINISSLNILGMLFSKRIEASFEEIESVFSENTGNVGRIFIFVKGKKRALIDIRNRKGDGSETIDSKTDGEIVAECLENLLIVEEE